MIPMGVLSSSHYVAPTGGSFFTYRASASDITDLTTYSFTGLDIGPEAADRVVIVAAAGRSNGSTNRTLSSLSIAGTNGTIDRAQGAWWPGGIVRRSVPTGTTADISVTFSGTMTRCAVFVYTSSDPVVVSGVNSTLVTDPSVSVNATAGGAIVAVIVNSQAEPSFTSGVTDLDGMFVLESFHYAAGAKDTASTEAVTVSAETGTGTALLVAVAYGPA